MKVYEPSPLRRKVEEAGVLFGSEIIVSEPDLWLPSTPALMKGKGSGCINMSQHEVQGAEIWLQSCARAACSRPVLGLDVPILPLTGPGVCPAASSHIRAVLSVFRLAQKVVECLERGLCSSDGHFEGC